MVQIHTFDTDWAIPPKAAENIRALVGGIPTGAMPSPRIAATLPAPWPDWRIPATLTRTPTGHSVDIDPEAMHQRSDGKTIYVDPVHGSDSRDGLTWATAKKTPNAAYADGNRFGVAELIIKGGIYTRAQSVIAYRRPDSIVRAAPGTRVVFTTGDTSTAWAAGDGPTWTVSMSTTGVVVDTSAPLTPSGLPVPLQAVASASECAATPGSAYIAGSAVTVHLHDGRQPDDSVLVMRSVPTMSTDNNAGSPFSILLDGVEYWGGTGSNIRATHAETRFIARNCAWRFSSNNGLSILGVGMTALLGCDADRNAVDGFNHHDYEGFSGDVLEAACTGRMNGTSGAPSSNGSSAHDTYRIVRVGGRYEYNPGPNIADVNNAKSVNLGVYAGDAVGYDGSSEYDFTAPEGPDGHLTLVDCVSTSARPLRSGANPVSVAGFRTNGTYQAETVPYV